MTTVACQTTPANGIQPQNQVSATEQPPGSQTGNDPVPFLSCFDCCRTDIREAEENTTASLTGDITIPPHTSHNNNLKSNEGWWETNKLMNCISHCPLL